MQLLRLFDWESTQLISKHVHIIFLSLLLLILPGGFGFNFKTKSQITTIHVASMVPFAEDDMYPKAIKTMRAAAEQSSRRPSTNALLAAIVTGQRDVNPLAQAEFCQALAGGGSPGRRWKLVYVCGKDAVIAAREKIEEQIDEAGNNRFGVLHPSNFGLLRWWPPTLLFGQYVDGFVSAIQRFDSEKLENENGIFAILGSDFIRFTIIGPFKWPDPTRRQVCAFRPTKARVYIGENWSWGSSLDGKDSTSFEDTKIAKLPFFKFILVDDKVAVAQGRSGSVALWTQIDS